MRKTICLVTNWYPTRDNPYYGSFFKEQAFALADYYDFLILHITERRGVFSSYSPDCRLSNKENNTVEYYVGINNSIIYDILNQFSDLKYRAKGNRDRVGIGKKLSGAYIKRKRRIMARLLRDNPDLKFDVLYCVDAQYEAGLLNILSDITGKPYIVSEHSPVPPPGFLINDLNYHAIEGANLFLAISHDKVRQMLMQGFKLPETVYIGNMVDDERFVSPDRSGHAIKKLLVMGANSFYKNYQLFFEVINRLLVITDTDFRVIVAGYAANKGYAKNVEMFEESLRSSAFFDRLELIPEIGRDEVAGVYAKADVFVMTSLQEGQPLAALEAGCCGLPVYSTRCGGVEDYVDEKMGRVYNITDAKGMAEGLRDFIEGKVSFDSVYIRDKIISLYGREAFAGNFSEAFENVLS